MIYSKKGDYSKEKMEMKRESLKMVLNSRKFTLKALEDDSQRIRRLRIPIFTPLYKLEKIKEY